MQILVFDLVFSIFGPGRGVGAWAASSQQPAAAPVIGSTRNGSNIRKSRAMLYSTVASDGGYILYSIVACYIVCYRTTKTTTPHLSNTSVSKGCGRLTATTKVERDPHGVETLVPVTVVSPLDLMTRTQHYVIQHA